MMPVDPNNTEVPDRLHTIKLWMERLSPASRELVKLFVSDMELVSRLVNDAYPEPAPLTQDLTTCLFHPDEPAIGWWAHEGTTAGYCEACMRTLRDRDVGIDDPAHQGALARAEDEITRLEGLLGRMADKRRELCRTMEIDESSTWEAIIAAAGAKESVHRAAMAIGKSAADQVQDVRDLLDGDGNEPDWEEVRDEIARWRMSESARGQVARMLGITEHVHDRPQWVVMLPELHTLTQRCNTAEARLDSVARIIGVSAHWGAIVAKLGDLTGQDLDIAKSRTK